MTTSTHAHTATGQHEPSWLPGVAVAMLPNIVCRTRRECAVLHRLTHDPRMRRVFSDVAKLRPLRLSVEHATGAMFSLAYHTAAEGRPVMLNRERARRIEAAGSWAQYFTSGASLGDGVAVSHMPDDPVAKRLQLTLAIWFERTFGGPHLGLAATITEVALDCRVSRYAGRLPGKPKRRLIRAAGC